MVELVALARHRYGTRDLRPGDRFKADRRDVGILLTLRRAKEVTPVAVASNKQKPDGIETLRAEYESQFGKKPDGRWKEARLRQELGARYERRDMRAET